MPHADGYIRRIVLPCIAGFYEFAHHAREYGADDGECRSDRSANIYELRQDNAKSVDTEVATGVLERTSAPQMPRTDKCRPPRPTNALHTFPIEKHSGPIKPPKCSQQ